MKSRIIETPPNLGDWFQTAPGRYLLDWERRQFDQAVVNAFGYHALQLGMPGLDALQANRMPHRWLALDTPAWADVPGLLPQRLALYTDFAALPFPAASLDLVVLPHTLEFHANPRATLREVERVLVPEGRLVLCGLNPVSLWGLRQWHAQLSRRVGIGELFFPDTGEFISPWRLRDWLRLLGFEVETSHFGCYRPPMRTEPWLRRFELMDWLGPRGWPVLGAVYFMVAVKRVHGMRLLRPGWKVAHVNAASPVSAARYHRPSRATTEHHEPH